MHDHNNSSEKNGGHKGMMWMMIPCLVLIVIVLFGGEKLIPSKYLWLIILGVCVVPHVWMMFKGHGNHGNNDKKDEPDIASEKQLETKDENNKHKSGGCCH